MRLSEHFEAFIPMGRAINPVTHTNWEGTGVIPDVAVAADDALRVAQIRLLQKIAKTTDDSTMQRTIEARRRQLGDSPL